MAEYENIELIVYAEHKSDFESMVQLGTVDNSQIGLIGDTGEVWLNGAYYPFAPQGASGNWALSFNVDSPDNDATKYTIQQGNAQLDILVPKITTDANGYIILTPTTKNIQLDGNETESVVSKLNISAKVKSISEASSTNNGLATAHDVKQELSKYMESGETIDVANDLTGVIEPTVESFVYRATADRKSVRDGSAVIRKIKGKSVIWEQKLNNPIDGNWSAFIPANITLSKTGREVRATVKQSLNITNPYEFGIHLGLPDGSVAGHKYLFCAMVKISMTNPSSGSNFVLEHDFNNYELTPAVFLEDSWHFVSAIWTSPLNNLRSTYIKPPYGFVQASAGDWYAIKDAMFFDLTQMFGAGKEPTTITEFRSMFPLQYYDYCPAAIPIGMSVEAIKAVGFNLFNKDRAERGIINDDGSIGTSSTYFVDTIRVMPSTRYYLKDVCNGANAVTYALYDGDMTPIGVRKAVFSSDLRSVSISIETTPETMYLRVCCHESSLSICCVNLRHSNVHDGEYKPYEEDTLTLPEVNKYFSQYGMQGIGDVYDEITSDGVVKRLDVVLLSDLAWAYDSITRAFRAPFDLYKVGGAALCNNYKVKTSSVNVLLTGDISLYPEGEIVLKDTNFTTVADIRDKLTRTYLVYELVAERRERLTSPLQLDYKVSDWGTEEAISSRMSAPFYADIVYAFNAEGRIRDTERNIEVLEERTMFVPYIIKSFTAYDFTVNEGTIYIEEFNSAYDELRNALRSCRPIYLKIAPEGVGLYGAVAMKYCYEEDLVYFSFFNPINTETYTGTISKNGVDFSIE